LTDFACFFCIHFCLNAQNKTFAMFAQPAEIIPKNGKCLACRLFFVVLFFLFPLFSRERRDPQIFHSRSG